MQKTLKGVHLKLFLPTLLVVAFCLGVIAYISHQQYAFFQANGQQATKQIEHEVGYRLLASQVGNREIVELLANNWGFIDNIALGATSELLDKIVPFTVHKRLDVINIYDTEATLLACAETPGLFGRQDGISPLLPLLPKGPALSPKVLPYNGKLAILTIKRLEGNYGPLGYLAVGQYLDGSGDNDFAAFYQSHHTRLNFFYQGQIRLVLGEAAKDGPSVKQKETMLTLPPGIDDSGLFAVQLIEDVAQAEQYFWHRFFIVFLIFTVVSVAVVFLSRRFTMEVTNELQDSRDALEKRVQERTREYQKSEERFRTLVNSLDSLVYVADMETYEILLINEYGLKIWGDLTGKICWQSLQTGQTGPCPFCTNNRLLDEKKEPTGTYVWEFQNTVDQEWYECRDQAIRWPDRGYVRMEIATNITERKRAGQALAEEKERLAVTLRSIGDGVITTDTQGRIVLINKIAEQLTGWESSQALGRPLAEVFHIVNEMSGEPCENPVEKVLASGKIVGLANHTILIAQDGQRRSIADSGAPIRDKESRTIGVVLVFRDISEQLRTEQELAKIRKLESVGVLAGGIAHDFNNILTAILGNLTLSLMDHALADSTQKRLREAEKATLRARDLTQQLLTFAKGGEPVKEAASLAEVVRESAEFMLRGNKVACQYHFADDLWLVEIDKGQISQVVQNIILNASQAMAGGGIVEVAAENVHAAGEEGTPPQKGDYVRLTITDHGIGIPANIIDKIFDPYFTTKAQGSGLGLAITHSIITKHGGQISVASTPGVGTTFTIHLPAAAQAATPDQPREARWTAQENARILVMDDDEQIRELTLAMLGQMGYEVLLAADGEEAIRLYDAALKGSNPIDLVIMDLTVPGAMGGKDAVREILAIDPQARVLVASGYSTDPILSSYKAYGFCGAIVKPFLIEELGEAIKTALGTGRK